MKVQQIPVLLPAMAPPPPHAMASLRQDCAGVECGVREPASEFQSCVLSRERPAMAPGIRHARFRVRRKVRGVKPLPARISW